MTKKKKMLEESDLIAAVAKAGETDLSDLIVEGFSYSQVDEAVAAGKLSWTESGGVKLAETKKAVRKSSSKKAEVKKSDDLPQIPNWLLGFAINDLERAKIGSVWEHNPAFRKRVLSTKPTDSIIGIDLKRIAWPPTERLRSLYEAAMRFQPLDSPSACNHPEMTAYGKQGNSVGFCVSCDGLVFFAVDGKPARVERERAKKK